SCSHRRLARLSYAWQLGRPGCRGGAWLRSHIRRGRRRGDGHGRRRGRRRRLGRRSSRLAVLLREEVLAISDLLLGIVSGTFRQFSADTQVLLEAADGLAVALILLEAASLIVDERRVFRVHEQLGENSHASSVVAREAGRPGRTHLLYPFGAPRFREAPGQEHRDEQKQRMPIHG